MSIVTDTTTDATDAEKVPKKTKLLVPSMRLCDVLALFIGDGITGRAYEKAMDNLWGDWGSCVQCNRTIALAAEVFWYGEREGFVHVGDIRREKAASWDKVKFPGHSESVAELLEKKKKQQVRAK